MSRLRPVVGGALYPRQRAPVVDSGTTVVAITSVMAAILLYALVWWVLGATDTDEDAAAVVAPGSALVRCEPRAPLSSSRA